jgi:hypothetical protein
VLPRQAGGGLDLASGLHGPDRVTAQALEEIAGGYERGRLRSPALARERRRLPDHLDGVGHRERPEPTHVRGRKPDVSEPLQHVIQRIPDRDPW